MVTDCQGTWAYTRGLAEGGAEVLTCTGCGELWVLRTRGASSISVGTFPKGTPESVLVEAVLRDALTSTPPFGRMSS
jgi:hypothetical protein